MNNFNPNYMFGIGAPGWIHAFGPWLAILLIWSLFWKGAALWQSARRGQGWWFLVLLIVNTAGILEIVYLFAVLQLKFSELLKK